MFTGKLHPYQEEAVDRLLERKSLLLAYGCGTGKTVMAIAAAEQLEGTVLIICPASLKYQWADKIKEFTTRPALVIDGDKNKRRDQYNRFQFGKDVPYIITGYDATIYDYEDISKLKPVMVICDEVSAIKSFKAMRSKRVKKLFGKTQYRLGLTATPIENRPEELYSIMQWVDPSVLGRYDLFDKAYITRNRNGWVVAYKNLDTLRNRMGDALARKTRHDADVRAYLPDVDEGTWKIEMDAETSKLYAHIARDMLAQIEENQLKYNDIDFRHVVPGFDETTPDGKLMAMYMCLEMLLDHPELIHWSAREYEKDSPNGSAYAHSLVEARIMPWGYTVPKEERLLWEMDRMLSDPESKVIIVSKYKYMLYLLSLALPMNTLTFTGDMNAKAKAETIDLFTNDVHNRVLLTSYAGGYGLDLYKADNLINYDLPWSAGTQDQINSRHVRASSGFDKVYVRNLITTGSVEERKLRILGRKGQLLTSVIDGSDTDLIEIDGDYLRTHLENFLAGGLTGRKSSGTIVTRRKT